MLRWLKTSVLNKTRAFKQHSVSNQSIGAASQRARTPCKPTWHCFGTWCWPPTLSVLQGGMFLPPIGTFRLRACTSLFRSSGIVCLNIKENVIKFNLYTYMFSISFSLCICIYIWYLRLDPKQCSNNCFVGATGATSDNFWGCRGYLANKEIIDFLCSTHSVTGAHFM